MMLRIVSSAGFKQLNRGRVVTRSGIGVRKQMLAPAETGEARSLRFCISTGAVDRELDRVALTGWDLAQYRRNPVVLWSHDAERLPIGRAVDLGVEDGRLMASVEFIPADLPEGGAFAESVYRLAREGYLAATSVGFRPIEWDYTDDPERGAGDWFPGIDFQRQELVEFSIVTIPANPEALIEAPAAGEGTAIASDTPPTTGEEVTAFVPDIKQEQARARARRARVLQLARINSPWQDHDNVISL